jgi:hypothetical protein
MKHARQHQTTERLLFALRDLLPRSWVSERLKEGNLERKKSTTVAGLLQTRIAAFRRD